LNKSVVRLITFIVITILIRFPFFFRDYIDRDESTFILMGQSWVDGFLPYTQLWDLKPPLVFLFFALIIQVFGKSYIAIRLIGALVIAGTAYFIYEIGKKGANERVGFFSGLIYIYLSSLFGSLQGVMSEHLAMFFFVLAFWRFLEARGHMGLFLSAVLFGASIMFRLNLAYPVTLLFVYYLLFSGWRVKEIALKAAVSMAGGFLAPFLTFIPYWLQGIPDIWWNSVILAPLNYDIPNVGRMLEAAFELSPFILLFLLGIWNRKRLGLFEKEPAKLSWIWVVFVGMLYMLIKSGKVNSHYLIQLFPFIILPVVAWIGQLKMISFQKVKPFLFALFLFIPVEAYLEYGVIGKRYWEGQSLHNGYGIEVPEYIEEHYEEEVSVFFLDYHIGYWELDQLPPSKIVTHPSNLLRKSNYSFIEETREGPLEELQYILNECKPNLIVSRSEHISFAEKDSEVNQYYEQFLEEHYQLVWEEKNAYVFKKISRSGL
jgi:4-amino-4-deoxy-L-arabinose transferase-like glycosyltransferase